VEQECVARLGAAFPNDGPIAKAGTVIGLEDAGKAGLLAVAEKIGRINMQDAPPL
jgi:hypothetical protein